MPREAKRFRERDGSAPSGPPVRPLGASGPPPRGLRSPSGPRGGGGKVGGGECGREDFASLGNAPEIDNMAEPDFLKGALLAKSAIFC